jgi:hypothetical protein
LRTLNLIEITTMFAIITIISLLLGGIILLIPTNYTRKGDKDNRKKQKET